MRRLPDETFECYQRSGLLRALQPRQWGGFELSPLSFFEAVAEVAAACPSSAWFLSVVGIHNWQLGLFPEEAQREASGGRAPFLDNPMQRYFRDVHAMRAHALNNPDKASQVFGYAELHPGGTPPEFFL